jgi:hypothetical protein
MIKHLNIQRPQILHIICEMCITGNSNPQPHASHNPYIPLATQSPMLNYWILFIYTNFSKSYIKFLDAKIISNKNIVNCKVIDLIEYYNFDVGLFLFRSFDWSHNLYLRFTNINNFK